MYPFDEYGLVKGIDTTDKDKDEDIVDVIDVHVVEKADGSKSNNQQERTSIQAQIQNIEVLFAEHELEETKAKLEQIETTLQQQVSQINMKESLLKEQNEIISKLILERDLADAERRMTKQQVSMLLDVKGAIETSAIAAQFYPIDHDVDELICPVESKLLTGLQNQLDLHNIILKQLAATKASSFEEYAKVIGSKDKSSLKLKLKTSWIKKLTARKRICVQFGSGLKWWSKEQKLYHAVNDYHQGDDVTSTNVKANHRSDANSWLINEIHYFDEKNRENIFNIHNFIRSQSNRIHLLQHEIEKLVAMQISCNDDVSTSSEENSSSESSCNEKSDN